MNAGTLIIGAGQAGVQLASALRQGGYAAPVTLVSAETHPPYQRPVLSTVDFLTKAAEPSDLALRAPDFYAQHGIDLWLGERIAQITLAEDGTGGIARTDGGYECRFDWLALATGAEPRQLVVPGAALDGVGYLRDLDDARWLRDRLPDAGRVVVIGGGFLGLEAASVAATAGCEVTVVEAADRLLPRVVAPVLSTFYQRAHQRRGVSLRLHATVQALHGEKGQVRAVELADATVLPTDLVVIAVGVRPCTDLAGQVGLDCADGIVVDEGARTSHPAVVAVGDCAAGPRSGDEGGRLRLESVPNAIAQARAAAATILGAAPGTREVPWFWSDQFDLKLQMVGIADGYDSVVVRDEGADERITVLYYRGDDLIALHAVNNPPDYLAGRLALTRQLPVPAELAADPGRRLRDVVGAARVSR